jgi:hypothetical protein
MRGINARPAIEMERGVRTVLAENSAMLVSKVPFAKLRTLLLGLGLVERLIEGKYRGFYHAESDTLFVFRKYRSRDKVSMADLVCVRSQLDWRGLLSKEAFDPLPVKPPPVVPFSALRKLLRKLGFVEKAMAGTRVTHVPAIVFGHAESGTVFMFRTYRPEERVSNYDLAGVRFQLDWCGLLSEEAFDAAVRAGVNPAAPGGVRKGRGRPRR